MRRGRRRERDGRWPSELLAYLRNSQVARPEIVAPLADTVRFVHREERHTHTSQSFGRRTDVESLGRHVEELHFSTGDARHALGNLALTECTVDERSRYAARRQRVDLILHQGDERADHDRQPGQQEGRYLIAHGLAAAGGQHDKGVAAGEHAADGPLLSRSEVSKTEPRAKSRASGVQGRSWCRGGRHDDSLRPTRRCCVIESRRPRPMRLRRLVVTPRVRSVHG